MTIVTEDRSTSFGLGLMLHSGWGWCCMHSTFFANSANFLFTWGLLVTIFHSTCIFCVGLIRYGTVLANTAVLCMRVHIVCGDMYIYVHTYMAPPGEWYYNTLLCCDYFSSSSVVSRAFSVLCMYSKFGHHPHSLGYLCAKFCFFCDLHCWARPWRKIVYSITHSYSINHSSSLFDAPGTEACTLEPFICPSTQHITVTFTSIGQGQVCEEMRQIW